MTSRRGTPKDGDVVCRPGRSGFPPDIPGKSVGDKPRPALVTYPENPAQDAQDFGNPKSEVRNPKQARNSNAEISKRSEGQFSFPADLIFLDCFGFRISGFEFPGGVFGPGSAGFGSWHP
jgi:hypothetical protein